ncbi:HAD-IIIC family phosphatase [Desertibaculum subflavum]|uniref:HAD-IIIC family phosphatase n=1 Tax=Desertibaculum subflavum TaxID=2268458 RepID=UPI0013C45B61
MTEGFGPHLGIKQLNVLHERMFGAAAPPPALPRSVRVAVLANHATAFLERGLRLALAMRGYRAEIYAAPYNQWQVELLAGDSGAAAFRPDVVLLTLTSQLLAYREAGDPEAFAADLARLVSGAAERLHARFVVTLPEPLAEEAEPTGWARNWRRRLLTAVETQLGGTAVLLDLDPLVTRIGAERWYAPRFFVNAKLIAHPDATAAFADHVAAAIAGSIRRAVRLVAVDLDDTLWGGVVGEVGWQGVDLDIEGRGFGHLRLQRFLLGLRERGIVLAAVSKNNERDAMEVFERRPEMLLKPEHFVEMRINWEPKSGNLADILDSLNLTPSGTCFLDDSRFEREEVRRLLPEVLVPEFPDDIADLVPALAASGDFSVPVVTAEDRARSRMYDQERQRRAARPALGDLDDYYRSLELQLTPAPLGPGNEQRVLDLIAKTNQFNLTGRRHGREALATLAAGGAEVWAYDLVDRFGGYGTIGVAILLREGDTARIDTWVLSCRAMGRTVESGILQHLAERARAGGARALVGEYVAGARNQPVAGLYPRLGFTDAAAAAESRRYCLVLDGALPASRFVTVRDAAPAAPVRRAPRAIGVAPA